MNTNISDENEKEICTTCFKSLGVPAKNKIYTYLRNNKNSSVNNLVEYVGLTQPTVSYHLKDMETNGLLKSERVGKEVYYSINFDCPTYGCKCLLKSIKFESIYA